MTHAYTTTINRGGRYIRSNKEGRTREKATWRIITSEKEGKTSEKVTGKTGTRTRTRVRQGK